MKSATAAWTRSWPIAVIVLAGCSPELDWREIQAPGTGLRVLLPCKPTHRSRTVAVAGRDVVFSLDACEAGGATWAIGYADVAEPHRVPGALAELRAAAQANIHSEAVRSKPLKVPGMTPQTESGHVSLDGRLPDGAGVRQETAVFAHGTWVFQGTVVGARLSDEGVTTFVESLRFTP